MDAFDQLILDLQKVTTDLEREVSAFRVAVDNYVAVRNLPPIKEVPHVEKH